MIEVKAGDSFITDDGDELRVEEVLEMDDEDESYIVRADDGQKYELEFDGEELVGMLVGEE